MTVPPGISSGTRRLALGLAAVATSASIAITWMAGRERGGTEAEQLIWVTVGLSLLLGAHLIPAMTHGARHGIRIVAYGLWAAAMVSTGYTHGTFFLAAQQHAGDVRAGQVAVPGAAPADLTTSEAISALLRQQARVEGALNQSTLAKCHDDCRALDVRRRTLRSQLDSIKGQLDQARRVERDNDRTAAERAHAIARQDSQRGDPVSTKLSLWLGVPATTIDLAMAIFFGWLLESIACFSWYVALSRPRQEQAPAEQREPAKEAFHLAADSPAPKPLAMIYTMSQPAANDSEPMNNAAQTRIPHAETASSAMSNSTLMRSDEEEERVLRDALESGAATNSISEIVRLLGCSEGRALTLRRQIAATSPQLLLATHRAVG
ncbi:hypothetical protein G3N59_08405 [Paraburkholderia sp. Ac-20340]|uniref:hypothetical protein n=1 Tax=Paraburkholderia sp. Ac-20340 TaxID=2703888 RepID=UPI00197CCCC6|nr:hypothetical protein [Paraburkholderia sp. Ac-20340]MBN3853394.1 hypothetical protein [Paraburkholderia sp. Ac-20340]